MNKLPLKFNDPIREIIHPCSEQEILLLPGDVAMTFVRCPAGSFMMGSPETELGHYLNETLHEETIEDDFWIGKFPVTEAQYDSLTRKPSPQGELTLFEPDAALGGITHTKAAEFCELMNKSLDLNGYEAALPSSIQWEYACRAGCSSALNNGTEITSKYGRCWNLGEVAWNPLDKVDCPQIVGKKVPNAWGIYDMHGNVWEWCSERYIHITKKGVVQELEGEAFVVRGGSCCTPPKFCRSACIKGMPEFQELEDHFCSQAYKLYGFRVVLNKKKNNG